MTRSRSGAAGFNIRVDSALYPGYEVLPFYESMMAKLIVRGKDRATAIANMQVALDAYKIEGLVVNIPLVQRVLAHENFRAGDFDNAFLERLLEQPAKSDGEIVAAIALSLVLGQERVEEQMPSKWRMHGRRMAMVNRLSNGGL